MSSVAGSIACFSRKGSKKKADHTTASIQESEYFSGPPAFKADLFVDPEVDPSSVHQRAMILFPVANTATLNLSLRLVLGLTILLKALTLYELEIELSNKAFLLPKDFHLSPIN